MLWVRPARLSDYESFVGLAQKAGPGFTSLAVADNMLRSRLEKSEKSFASDTVISPDHLYLLMLEDSKTGEVVGVSAVKAQIGIRDPFYNFRVLKVAQMSQVTQRRFDMDVLMMVNEYPGATEVGTLFVLPEYRGTGAGRLISQARYMLIASDRERFAETVVSELRGSVDEEGHSPFWEAVGRKFFLMDFTEADNISAEKDNQFILDLMPKYPIYAALLPDDAQAAIGQTHPSGKGARRLLEAEGFNYEGVIDVFDGGPSMSVRRDQIRTVRDSRTVTVAESDVNSRSLRGLVSNDRIGDFRCVYTRFSFDEDRLALSADDMDTLNLKAGETARIWINR